MSSDKKQYVLKRELQGRRDWYFELSDKIERQLKIAPRDIQGLMKKLIAYLEKTAIPTVDRLLSTLGKWERDTAVEFYDANNEVCRLSDLINSELMRYKKGQL